MKKYIVALWAPMSALFGLFATPTPISHYITGDKPNQKLAILSDGSSVLFNMHTTTTKKPLIQVLAWTNSYEYVQCKNDTFLRTIMPSSHSDIITTDSRLRVLYLEKYIGYILALHTDISQRLSKLSEHDTVE